MLLTKPIVQALPFPYFYIDEQFEIHYQSEVAFTLFQNEKNFLNIIMADFHKNVIKFIHTKTNQSLMKVPFHLNDQPPKDYYVYKLCDINESNIHLFCFHPEDELHHLNSLIQKREKFLEEINKEIRLKVVNSKEKTDDIDAENMNSPRVSALAAGIAHEIRNPLTTVKGFIQLLKPYLTDIGKDYYADVALDEIDRVNNIIYEFLLATKPKVTGKFGITLSKLLYDLFIFYESETILHNIQLVLHPVKEDIFLTIEIQQVKQVLANIIKNAIEAINECQDERVGRIEICTQFTSKNVCIVISDNGIGMKKEMTQKLFQPFYTTKKKGTGIGLSICKEIIEANDGTIHVKSEYGQGTTFSICLPINDDK